MERIVPYSYLPVTFITTDYEIQISLTWDNLSVRCFNTFNVLYMVIGCEHYHIVITHSLHLVLKERNDSP